MELGQDLTQKFFSPSSYTFIYLCCTGTVIKKVLFLSRWILQSNGGRKRETLNKYICEHVLINYTAICSKSYKKSVLYKCMAKEPHLNWGFGESLSKESAVSWDHKDEYEWRRGKRGTTERKRLLNVYVTSICTRARW